MTGFKGMRHNASPTEAPPKNEHEIEKKFEGTN